MTMNIRPVLAALALGAGAAFGAVVLPAEPVAYASDCAPPWDPMNEFNDAHCADGVIRCHNGTLAFDGAGGGIGWCAEWGSPAAEETDVEAPSGDTPVFSDAPERKCPDGTMLPENQQCPAVIGQDGEDVEPPEDLCPDGQPREWGGCPPPKQQDPPPALFHGCQTWPFPPIRTPIEVHCLFGQIDTGPMP